MIIPPSLHTILGPVKIFVNALDKNGAGFRYLKEQCPRVSESKITEGILVGTKKDL
jgi:hypothetical protein